MKYAENYVRSAVAIIEAYKADMPFGLYVKSFFAANKKFGSKDRRYISQLCYAYFRTGHALDDYPIDWVIRAGLFLCNSAPGIWSSLYEVDWLSKWSVQLKDRIDFIQQQFSQAHFEQLFPCTQYLSKSIDKVEFYQSHLIQPDLFIRVRPGRLSSMVAALTSASIDYTIIGETCFALPNGTKLDGVGEIDKDYVVQDYSSQQTGQIMEAAKQLRKGKDATVDVWDCCAASGGKSILARDILGNMDLTVSDLRKSIIHNLSQRFERAGIKKYQSVVADLSQPIHAPELAGMQFDLIICDAPCSGSGTWGRTPEMLRQFKAEQIESFKQLQQQIVQQAITKLRINGYFLYITCSVFEAENEAMIPFILNRFSHLSLVQSELIKGYGMRADTMFVALFKHQS